VDQKTALRQKWFKLGRKKKLGTKHLFTLREQDAGRVADGRRGNRTYTEVHLKVRHKKKDRTKQHLYERLRGKKKDGTRNRGNTIREKRWAHGEAFPREQIMRRENVEKEERRFMEHHFSHISNSSNGVDVTQPMAGTSRE